MENKSALGSSTSFPLRGFKRSIPDLVLKRRGQIIPSIVDQGMTAKWRYKNPLAGAANFIYISWMNADGVGRQS